MVDMAFASLKNCLIVAVLLAVVVLSCSILSYQRGILFYSLHTLYLNASVCRISDLMPRLKSSRPWQLRRRSSIFFFSAVNFI